MKYIVGNVIFPRSVFNGKTSNFTVLYGLISSIIITIYYQVEQFHTLNTIKADLWSAFNFGLFITVILVNENYKDRMNKFRQKRLLIEDY